MRSDGRQQYSSTRTAGDTRAVKVKNATTVIIAANDNARRGLRIQNDDATQTLYLGLGKPAEAGKDIAVAPGATWDGRVGAVQWNGAVNGIVAGADINVLVVEVE